MYVASVIVIFGFSITCWLALTHPLVFANVSADVGYRHYAERLHILPLKAISHTMPFNTLITYVYSLRKLNTEIFI